MKAYFRDIIAISIYSDVSALCNKCWRGEQETINIIIFGFTPTVY